VLGGRRKHIFPTHGTPFSLSLSLGIIICEIFEKNNDKLYIYITRVVSNLSLLRRVYILTLNSISISVHSTIDEPLFPDELSI